MAFEPIGGYPPIRPKVPGQTDAKNLESRGFTGNPVSVATIMSAKKKRDFLSAFGTEEDLDIDMSRVFADSPNEYDDISYDEPDYDEPKKTSKNTRGSTNSKATNSEATNSKATNSKATNSKTGKASSSNKTSKTSKVQGSSKTTKNSRK